MNINFYLQRFKDSFFYLSAALVKLPIAVFTSPIFSKNLSVSDFAAIGYFNTLSTFLMPIIALMFYNYYMTGYHGRSKMDNVKILQSLVSFLLLVDVFIIVIAFLVLKYYLLSSGSTFNAYPLGIIVFITAMFNMAIGFWGITMRFERKSFKYFILQTSTMLFSTGLGVILVVNFQMGAVGRLLPNMIFNIALFVLFFLVIVKKFKLDLKIIKDAWLFCYPMILSGFLALPIMYFDKILLERLHNNVEFGLYNIANTIAGYYGMTTMALFQAFQPDIFSNVEKGKKKTLIHFFLILVGLFILGGIIFYFISPYAVDYLTAGIYVDSLKYIAPLILISALQPITYFFTYILIAMKLPKLDLFNQIAISAFSVLIYYLLINYFQFFGALYAKVVVLLLLILIVSIEIYIRKHKYILFFITKSN